MNKRIAFGALALALVAPVAASAQDEPIIIFAQYLRCAPAQQDRANEIERTIIQPIGQKHIDAGHIAGITWRNHLQGGSWRAFRSMLGTDINVMMDVSQQMVTEFREQHPAEATEYANICGSHDDYIWTEVARSPTVENAPEAPASISTYYVCDVTRQTRADEIFEELLAPLYKKHTDMGHLANWGFFAHRSGGMFRRLETFAGADHKTLLQMQDAIYSEAGETDALAMREFNEICNSHTDYMWISPGM